MDESVGVGALTQSQAAIHHCVIQKMYTGDIHRWSLLALEPDSIIIDITVMSPCSLLYVNIKSGLKSEYENSLHLLHCYQSAGGSRAEEWGWVAMVNERSDWIERLQNQVDIQKAAEQLEAFIDLFGGLVFEVALQLTAQAIVAAL